MATMKANFKGTVAATLVSIGGDDRCEAVLDGGQSGQLAIDVTEGEARFLAKHLYEEVTLNVSFEVPA